jgi:hypothetical protein
MLTPLIKTLVSAVFKLSDCGNGTELGSFVFVKSPALSFLWRTVILPSHMACNIVMLHPFIYVIDSKRALSFGEAQPNIFIRTAPKRLCAFLLPNETKSAEVLPAVPPGNYH